MGVKATGSRKNPAICGGVADTLLQRFETQWETRLANIDVETAGTLFEVLFPEYFSIPPGESPQAVGRRMFPERKPDPQRLGRLTAAERQRLEQESNDDPH